MSEELKQEEKCCKCECKELLAKLAIITTGSFIGCLLALCVFTTFAKQPVPPRQHHFPPAASKFMQKPPTAGKYDRHGKFHPYMNKSEDIKKHHKKDFKKEWKKDFEKQRPDKPEKK